MIVGEQPGDHEELSGRPFVGPAGQVLDLALERAGIDRSRAWVTNAVKHFKHEPRGSQRLHKNPNAGEIDHCRWWLDRERELVRPSVLLSLGASALRGLTGRTQSINQVRGQPQSLPDGSEVWPTVHPSYLLRLDGAAREREAGRFADDLRAVSMRLAALSMH
jgi:DNA polymerase